MRMVFLLAPPLGYVVEGGGVPAGATDGSRW